MHPVKYCPLIIVVPSDHLIVSNRSHAHTCLKSYNEALSDADLTIQLRPDWAKAQQYCYMLSSLPLLLSCFKFPVVCLFLKCMFVVSMYRATTDVVLH